MKHDLKTAEGFMEWMRVYRTMGSAIIGPTAEYIAESIRIAEIVRSEAKCQHVNTGQASIIVSAFKNILIKAANKNE